MQTIRLESRRNGLFALAGLSLILIGAEWMVRSLVLGNFGELFRTDP